MSDLERLAQEARQYPLNKPIPRLARALLGDLADAALAEREKNKRLEQLAEQRARYAHEQAARMGALAEKNKRLEEALRRVQAMAIRGVGADTTPAQVLVTIDAYIEKRLARLAASVSPGDT